MCVHHMGVFTWLCRSDFLELWAPPPQPSREQSTPMVAWVSLRYDLFPSEHRTRLPFCCLCAQSVKHTEYRVLLLKNWFWGGLPIHQHHNPKLYSPWTSSIIICKTFSMFEPRTAPWTLMSLSPPACNTSLAADHPPQGLGITRLALWSWSAQHHCLLCLPRGFWPQYDQGEKEPLGQASHEVASEPLLASPRGALAKPGNHDACLSSSVGLPEWYQQHLRMGSKCTAVLNQKLWGHPGGSDSGASST